LQDHRRAIVVGIKSFGKGSVQTIIPLQNGGAMRLTTARYFTPSGRSIQAEGIQPDIEVQQAKVEEIKPNKTLHEADLRGALKNPQEGDAKKDGKKDEKKKEPPPQTDSKNSEDKPAVEINSASATPDEVDADPDAPKDKDKDAANKDGAKDPKTKPVDYQLARAVDLLRGIALYEKKAAPAEEAKPAAATAQDEKKD
jgi:carboxyl-terminal processing protease